MIDTLLFIIALVLMVACHLIELTRCLMMYQQNSYRNERYMKWLSTSGDTTSIPRLIALVLFFLSISVFSNERLTYVSIPLFAAIMGIKMATKRYKKPLVWTARAIRLYAVSVILSGLLVWAASFVIDIVVATLLVYCLSHVVIMATGIILLPVDKLINLRYINDARRRLKSMPELKIVGITGSYGKTSTKHYLHRILSEQFDTLMTPGSFNTTLGVVRTVREYLKPYNEVFIVEMGAKQPGDIKEICDLVHPTIGIVTAVGPQ
ncbi:MAG: Mur ligase family protein, partial [Muribaculaceae bacterium]